MAFSADNILADQKLSTAELLYRQAKRMGLRPSWIVTDGLFAISVGGRERYVNLAISELNSHTGSSLTRNKYLTRLILQRHNLQNIPFCSPKTHAEAIAFLQQHGKIIAKPLKGSGAQDVHIITQAAQLEALLISGYILEKYIAGKELRYLVLNGVVIGVYRSRYGVSVAEDRPLQCISIPHSSWSGALMASSITIAQLLGLKFAAVDYLIDDAGCAYVLEVNTAPDLKWFHAPTSGPVVDVARLFMESLLEDQSTPPEKLGTRLQKALVSQE